LYLIPMVIEKPTVMLTVKALEFMFQALFSRNTSLSLNDVREALAATNK